MSKEILAPMPGTIINILVSEGDEVLEYQEVVILEAIKMENAIPSPEGRVVKEILSPEKVGANVTVPYKEDVIPFLDELDGLARDIGAVNTIVKRGDRLVGYNTDAGGFLRALKEKGEFDPRGKRVTMIGAGGFARAISFVMIKAGVISLFLYDIEIERAERRADAGGDRDFHRRAGGELHAVEVGIGVEPAVLSVDICPHRRLMRRIAEPAIEVVGHQQGAGGELGRVRRRGRRRRHVRGVRDA